jgi:4-oxalocrotonate tautomerase
MEKSMPIIIVHILEGRSKDQKRALIHALTHAASKTLDAPLDAVRVVINEMERSNFGIGGTTAEHCTADPPVRVPL